MGILPIPRSLYKSKKEKEKEKDKGTINNIMKSQFKDKTYNDYGQWIRQQFPFRVQKISVDAGFSCPNRDGTLSHGGC